MLCINAKYLPHKNQIVKNRKHAWPHTHKEKLWRQWQSRNKHNINKYKWTTEKERRALIDIIEILCPNRKFGQNGGWRNEEGRQVQIKGRKKPRTAFFTPTLLPAYTALLLMPLKLIILCLATQLMCIEDI